MSAVADKDIMPMPNRDSPTVATALCSIAPALKWLTAGAGALVATAALRRARCLTGVAPELRSVLLLAPGSLNRVMRGLVQRLVEAAPVPDPANVRMTAHHVPRSPDIPETRLLVLERVRASGARPMLLWMHGGGYVIGTPEQDIAFLERLIERFDIVVVSVAYRLAPEHRFPAPLDDCHAALAWAVQHAATLGIDPARIMIGGQSAGGGLAAALVQRTVDQGPITPIFQVLIYPMLDAATVDRTDDAGTGAFIWTRASNRYGWRSYLGAPRASGDYPAYAVPAARGDLSALPPAWIGVGTLDLFYAEDCAYAARMRQAGVACALHSAEGAYHGFDIFFPEAAITARFTPALFAAIESALG